MKKTNKNRKNFSNKKKKTKKYIGGNVFTPKTYEELKDAVDEYNDNDWEGDLGEIGTWNTEYITDMHELFLNTNFFNGDISKWNVSNVTNMSRMFESCTYFDQSLKDWNVSKVTDMSNMFFFASMFNQDISKWDVSNVKDMSHMFTYAEVFDQDLSNWKLHPDVDVEQMFHESGISSKHLPKELSRKKNSDIDIITDPVIENYSAKHTQYIDKQYRKYKNLNFKLTICDAVYLYQKIFDNYINGILRNDLRFMVIKNPDLLHFFNIIINTFDDYFVNHAPRITKDMVYSGKNIIYRGEKELCADGTCRSGTVPSYTSSTTSISIAYGFTNKKNCCLYKYELSEGVPYIDVDKMMKDTNKYCGVKLSPPHEEKEYILPRGIILSNELTEAGKIGPHKSISLYKKTITYDENYIKNNPIDLTNIVPNLPNDGFSLFNFEELASVPLPPSPASSSPRKKNRRSRSKTQKIFSNRSLPPKKKFKLMKEIENL